MALDPLELMVIGVIAIVIFLWGPQKIPELARALGRAKKEFDQASKEVTSAVSTQATPPASGDEILVSTAKKLGIATEGKTREEISSEIVKRNTA